MNEHSAIARELRKAPEDMLSTRVGSWELALWDKPAEQVGGCLPMAFPALGTQAGEWVLAPGDTHSGGVMVLASTQLRDMAAARLGLSLRAMSRALLRLNMTAEALHEAILGELTGGGATTAPVSLVSAFLDGDNDRVEVFRHGEVSIWYRNSAVAEGQWWGAGEHGTGQLDQRRVIDLGRGGYVIVAADSIFDLVSRDRRRLRPSDLESWATELASASAAEMANGLAARVRDFAAGEDLDEDVTLFVIGPYQGQLSGRDLDFTARN